LIQVVEGNFKKKTVECLHPDCPNPERRFFKTREEKRTDVNMAIEMLDDAYQSRCDRLVLISGDSDLVPALELIGTRFPAAKINVYIPVRENAPIGERKRSYKKELRSVATTVRELPSQLLAKSQFPNPVILPDGTAVYRPAGWEFPKPPRPPLPAPVMPADRPCQWCGRP
jgi:uncharacterized LabA/DUF88 family protein